MNNGSAESYSQNRYREDCINLIKLVYASGSWKITPSNLRPGNLMFLPRCLPILIGSLPLTDHLEAVQLILAEASEIPLWPQLPKLPGEGMVRQFISGFPGLHEEGTNYWIDSDCMNFEEQMTEFYQEYMDIEDNPALLNHSRFALGKETTKGFSVFLNSIEQSGHQFKTLKGQITGPVTTGIGVKDQHDRSIFYSDDLRDMLVKMLSLKAKWQVREMRKYTVDTSPIIFIDEPGIVSFGSSAFLGITKEMVTEAVGEVIEAIQREGGLAGVHICANGDWSPVLASAADIISFDAYFYFDNFILYKEMLSSYLERGGLLAWGIVPTSDPDVLNQIDSNSLVALWQQQVKRMSNFGIAQKKIMEQTLIAPSCGTGSLSVELAQKVLTLTSEVSVQARELLQAI